MFTIPHFVLEIRLWDNDARLENNLISLWAQMDRDLIKC